MTLARNIIKKNYSSLNTYRLIVAPKNIEAIPT